METVTLRRTEDSDLPILFEFESDPKAARMAAFPPEASRDPEAFYTHWRQRLASPADVCRTVLVDGHRAGVVMKFEFEGDPSVAYWLGREFWGRGIATRALSTLLEEVRERPLYARVAHDNRGSIRVLEKCGFRKSGRGRRFAQARGEDLDEFVYRLDRS